MRWGRILALVAATLALLGLAACSARPELPDLTGMTLPEASKALEERGVAIGPTTYDPRSGEPTWTVLSATEDRGEGGWRVSLVLARGRPTSVPEVIGGTREEASEKLRDAGLVLGRAAEVNDNEALASRVMKQSLPSGTLVPAGSAVDVVVSLGRRDPPSDSLRLSLVRRLVGPYSPKSVVASQHGLVFAQNMIYRHTITVFDERTHEVVKTIADDVTPADFGYPQYPAKVKGGPVEAAFSPDGRYAFVSNYSMYGPGFRHPGEDSATPEWGVDRSFLYRIPLDTLAVDRITLVGAVPKYVAVTPDSRLVLVSNWVSFTVSVVDAQSGKQLREIRIGRHPRGIAIDPSGRRAWIAVMGSSDIAQIDLKTFSVGWIEGVGSGPRHVVVSPEGRYLYATLNGAGKVAKIDIATSKVISRASAGRQPRSMTMAPDGLALYVVNYESGTVSKIRTSDMKVIQEVKTDMHPIGITYVDATREIWVSCYRGSILVFHDS